MPAAYCDDSVEGFPPPEVVVPGKISPSGASEMPVDTLPSNDNRAVNNPPIDGASSDRSAPQVEATGFDHADLHLPSSSAVERLPPCADTADNSPTNTFYNLGLVVATKSTPTRR
jgi:hypothetical protein